MEIDILAKKCYLKVPSLPIFPSVKERLCVLSNTNINFDIDRDFKKKNSSTRFQKTGLNRVKVV